MRLGDYEISVRLLVAILLAILAAAAVYLRLRGGEETLPPPPTTSTSVVPAFTAPKSLAGAASPSQASLIGRVWLVNCPKRQGQKPQSVARFCLEQPAAAAPVTVVSASSTIKVKTRANGLFLVAAPVGDYRLTATLKGRTATARVTVDARAVVGAHRPLVTLKLRERG